MEAKHWFMSKTLWANALAMIAAVTGAVGMDLGLTPEVQAQIVVGIMAVVNIFLRIVTKSPVGK